MWFRFTTLPVLTAFVVSRVVRYLPVDDAMDSAAVSLTLDFLFGSVVNWLFVGLVLVAIVHDVASPPDSLHSFQNPSTAPEVAISAESS